MNNFINYTDESLMDEIANANKKAYSILVDRYIKKAIFTSKQIVYKDYEDITQATFIKVWENAKKYDKNKAKFTTWFYKILTNTCYDYIKKEKKYIAYEIRLEDVKVNNLEELFFAKEENNYLKYFISALKKREQQVIILKYFNGMSNKESAMIIGTTEKGVESLLARARKKLKISLENIMDEKCYE